MHTNSLESATELLLAGWYARFLLARGLVLKKLFRQEHPGSRRYSKEHRQGQRDAFAATETVSSSLSNARLMKGSALHTVTGR